jgi:hypothetical protein
MVHELIRQIHDDRPGTAAFVRTFEQADGHILIREDALDIGEDIQRININFNTNIEPYELNEFISSYMTQIGWLGPINGERYFIYIPREFAER